MAVGGKRKSLLYWLQQRRRKRRRSGDADAGPRSLGDLIRSLEPAALPRDPHRPAVALDLWEKIVGRRIADRSFPQKIEPDSTLVVRVPSSVWAQELSLLSSTIIQRLGDHGTRIAQLRFVVGRVEPPRRAPTRFEHRTVAAPVTLPKDLVRLVDGIDDAELRDAIAQAAASSLGYAAAEAKRAQVSQTTTGKGKTPGRKG